MVKGVLKSSSKSKEKGHHVDRPQLLMCIIGRELGVRVISWTFTTTCGFKGRRGGIPFAAKSPVKMLFGQ